MSLHTKLSFMRLLPAVLLLLTVSVTAKTIDQTFDAKSGGELYLRTDAGRLIIDTHNNDSVVMHVEVSGEDAQQFELNHEVDGDKISIYGELENRSSWGWNRELKVEFRVTVPRQFNLQLQTGGGSINIEDLAGNVEAKTSGGSINVGSIQGDVKLNTSGGSISTDEIFGQINAHTAGGSIRVSIAKQPTEDTELTTSGGSITAYLPKDVKIDLDASTSGGRVKSDFDVDGRVKKQSIRGEINGGGPSLELHTSGGSVSIKKL